MPFACSDGGAEGDGGAVTADGCFRVVVRAASREGCQRCRHHCR
ncbi:hypothetical protein NXV86_16850 [Bacteroides sp. BFG-257]|nr:hypothetical protein [Bacteroides sp. BFG-257]UVO96646.1 hypothetical protein NXV86_16850 [Bacteroides sp. BFG-257]